jgi:hypothetical protein
MVRLNRRTEVENTLFALGIMLLVLTFFLFKQGTTGYSRRGRYSPPNPALVPYAVAGLVVSLAFLATRFCFRNYYLIDPDRHCVFRAFRLFWFHRVRLLFEQEDIAGIATDGRRFTTKHSTYWAYRVVALSTNGAQEALTDWRRERLDECNAEAVKLAGVLNCQSHMAPPKSALQFDMAGQNALVSFRPYDARFIRDKLFRLLLALLFALLISGVVFFTTAKRHGLW